MTNCSHCGTQNVDDSKYCKSCGTRLTSPSYVRCRQCGSFNPSDSAYCNRCGERLIAGAPIPPPEKIPLDSQPQSAASIPPPDGSRAAGESPAPTGDSRSVALRRLSAITQKERIETTLSREEEAAEPADALIEESSLPTQGLIPTHELLRMANALGIDIDYSTLRFWQKRGLVAKPLRGPVETGRGTRGYYDASLIERLAFIREIQKTYSMGLDAIREELERIDRQIAQAGNAPSPEFYRERLQTLQTHRDVESRRTLLAVLGKALGIAPNDIATVIVRKKDGQTLRFIAERIQAEPPPPIAPPAPLRPEMRETLERVREKLEKSD